MRKQSKQSSTRRRLPTFQLLVLFLFSLTALPPAAFVASRSDMPLSSYLTTLAQSEPDERIRVIVQLNSSLSNTPTLVEQLEGRYLRALPLINAFVAELPAHALPDLAAMPAVKWISLDAPIVKMSESSAGVVHARDEFSQIAFTNHDGDLFWRDAWQEIGESDGPADGDIAITPFWGGALQGLRLQGAARGVMRAVDLTHAAQATLAVAYRRKEFAAENAAVVLTVSTDGGATWQEVTRWGGPGTDAEIQSGYYDLNGYVGQPLLIQFSTTATMNPAGKFYLDVIDLQVTPDVAAAAPLVRKNYLPLVVGPDAATVDSATVQAAAYNPAVLASTYVKAIGADRLWTEAPGYLTGQGVTVAVVDSGITEHPDLKKANGQSRVLARVSFVQDGKSPDDFYGHGTHVAGIVGGNGTQSGGKYMGVAPDVNLLDVKVTDDQGIGKMSDVVAGLQWVLNNKNTYNIRVVNLSLNSTVPDSYHVSPLNAAVEILWFNGLVVVVSAGNEGSYKLNAPANDPFVITVGAADDKGTADLADDELAKFSAYNITEDGFAKPDLIAPGRNLVALLSADDNNLASNHPNNKLAGSEGTAYYKMSGTSMASAVVAGAVALLLQKEPTLNPDQVKYRLMKTAKTFATAQGCAAGAGYLDIYAATKAATTNSANTGVTASRLLWSGAQPITWSSVSWNSVSWNSVSWNSVSWNSVSWNSVSWNSVSWNSTSTTESAPQYSCYDVSPTGLLGQWRMDETNGTLIADASGNNNVGLFESDVSRQSNGKRNGAVELNGGVINIASPANLSTVTDQLTVSLWLNRTRAADGWQAAISRQYGDDLDDQFYLSIVDDSYVFGINTPNDGNQHTWGGVNGLNQWVHLAGVYDGSQITLYVNGVAMNSRPMSGQLNTGAKPLLIGGNANTGDPNVADELFAGQVDDIRIYRRALSTAEIMLLASGNMPAPQAPAVSLTAPTANATFYAPASISLAATASDSDGTVSKVEFFNGTTRLGEDTTAPYAFTWNNVTLGSYSLTAKATDNSGATTTSVAVGVTVTPAPTFYRAINLNGSAVTIDGRTWENGTTANLSSGPNRFCNQTVPLTPATDSTRATMMRCSVWGSGPVGAQVTVSAVPNATYQVYLYVWEDNNAETFSIKLNGVTVHGSFYSGAAGAWRKLGPWTTTVTNGQIKLESSGGSANFSGVEIWRQ